MYEISATLTLPQDVAYYIPAANQYTEQNCATRNGAQHCTNEIGINNAATDDRGFVYIVDRYGTGTWILDLTGEPAVAPHSGLMENPPLPTQAQKGSAPVTAYARMEIQSAPIAQSPAAAPTPEASQPEPEAVIAQSDPIAARTMGEKSADVTIVGEEPDDAFCLTSEVNDHKEA